MDVRSSLSFWCSADGRKRGSLSGKLKQTTTNLLLFFSSPFYSQGQRLIPSLKLVVRAADCVCGDVCIGTRIRPNSAS